MRREHFVLVAIWGSCPHATSDLSWPPSDGDARVLERPQSAIMSSWIVASMQHNVLHEGAPRASTKRAITNQRGALTSRRNTRSPHVRGQAA
jgi:hypothetical protein